MSRSATRAALRKRRQDANRITLRDQYDRAFLNENAEAARRYVIWGGFHGNRREQRRLESFIAA